MGARAPSERCLGSARRCWLFAAAYTLSYPYISNLLFMGMIIAISVNVVLCAVNYVFLTRRPRDGPLLVPWHMGVIAALCLGCAAGVWCGFYAEYAISDDLKVASLPVPG